MTVTTDVAALDLGRCLRPGDRILLGRDVALIQVSPADAGGNHSFGLMSDHVQAAVAKARVVIV